MHFLSSFRSGILSFRSTRQAKLFFYLFHRPPSPRVFEATTDLPEAQTAALRLAIAYLCDSVAVLVVSAPSAGASAGGGFIYDWLLRALVMPFLNGYFPFVIFMNEHRD